MKTIEVTVNWNTFSKQKEMFTSKVNIEIADDKVNDYQEIEMLARKTVGRNQSLGVGEHYLEFRVISSKVIL